jgi:hypothetical protein
MGSRGRLSSPKEGEDGGGGIDSGDVGTSPAVGVDKMAIGSQEGGRGILARGLWCPGCSIMLMQSEEEATGPGIWRGTQARRGPVWRDTKEGGARRLTGHTSGEGRWCGSTCGAKIGEGHG